MPENMSIPDPEAVPETAKEKFERERFSRRQALKKFGITSAVAAFALFSVDDLAHMVGKAMQQRAGDNKVVIQVAKEFQQSGVAMAAVPYDCQHCCNQFRIDDDYCATLPAAQQENCYCVKSDNFSACYDAHWCVSC